MKRLEKTGRGNERELGYQKIKGTEYRKQPLTCICSTVHVALLLPCLIQGRFWSV